MKCRDVKGLLSAYANNELTTAERETVEQHIAGCPDCRVILQDYKAIRQKLSTLQEMPAGSEIREAVIARIRQNGTSEYRRLKWLRPVLLGTPILAAVVAGLMIWQPWSPRSGSQSVMAKAQAAISSVQSYRMSVVQTNYVEGQVTETRTTETEFMAPDRYHYTQDWDSFNMEYIMIGDELYKKKSDSVVGYDVGSSMWSSVSISSSIISREYTVMILEYLKNIETLQVETIDNVTCLHYRGEYDFERQLRSMREQNVGRGTPPMSEEEIAEIVEEWESKVGLYSIELWIGEDDYLIRQGISETQRLGDDGVIQTSRTISTYSDFNEPVIIESPLDKNGQLLLGWITGMPEFPNISTDI